MLLGNLGPVPKQQPRGVYLSVGPVSELFTAYKRPSNQQQQPMQLRAKVSYSKEHRHRPAEISQAKLSSDIT